MKKKLYGGCQWQAGESLGSNPICLTFIYRNNAIVLYRPRNRCCLSIIESVSRVTGN